MTKALYKKAWILLSIIICSNLKAQTYVNPSITITKTSFAVFTDEQTYDKCNIDLKKYKQTLENEGLPTFIIYKNWKNPEEVKNEINKLYQTRKLEGIVLIGDIPITMIRKAQHLTSAFKMDERNDIFESSVPSDRFYDDLHLKFDFIKQDKNKPLFFYYNLSAISPQEIQCNIYSGRIKPLNNGTDKYQQINFYLNKAIKQHHENNILNQFTSYTGEGSYSNSLLAWTPEATILQEQLPSLFNKHSASARFLRYSYTDFPKEDVINELKRNDLDLAIFHEHGMPNRQYLSGIADTYDFNSHIVQIKADLRSSINRYLSRKGNKGTNEFYKSHLTEYGLDSTWVAGYNEKKTQEEDSIIDIRRGLLLDDITRIKPNARFVILDACYNGDFREDDYIGGRYIFASGNCVATFANTVNVLQDKQANEMIGLLGEGARIGQWARFTNILESHIEGDPTYRFAASIKNKNIINNILDRTCSTKALLQYLNGNYQCDVQSLALHALYYKKYANISNLLYNEYITSPYAMVRYTCFNLLEHINDVNFENVLKVAVNDTYEFIRRIAVNRMGKIGKSEYLPYLVKTYINDRQAERIIFNVLMSLRCFESNEVKQVTKDIVSHSYALNKDAIINELTAPNITSLSSSINEDIFNKKLKEKNRYFSIVSLKNMPLHPMIEKYLTLIQDPTESANIRVSMLQSLSWFNLSYKKNKIIEVCKDLMNDKLQDSSIREESLRTYYRLTMK